MIEHRVLFRVVERGPSRLALLGELDVAGVPDLEEQLASCDGDVVLDCSGLTFVDASGVGSFVRARNACLKRGVTFALVEPSACVVRVLAVTGLDAVFLHGADGPGS